MLHFSTWKIIAIALVCLFGLAATVPNFFPESTVAKWPSYVPNKQLSLGLDLQGGAHLLMQLDEAELKKDWLGTLRGDVRRKLIDSKIGATGVGITPEGVRANIAKPEQMDQALKALRELIQPIGNAILGSSGEDTAVTKIDDRSILIAPTQQGFNDRLSKAAAAAMETIRSRIDELGTKEPNIVRQGTSRVLIQVPGFDDTQKLIEIIGSTAKLTFHDVHPQVSAAEARETRVPFGYKIYPSRENEDIEYLLKEIPVVQGADLANAQQGVDGRTGEPVVNFRFNVRGGLAFATFTKKNVGRPFAIVLDGEVLSAPVIREPITGGSGQISGGFTNEETKNLSIQLRSGALPTSLTVAEQRTVGPSLGLDSVEAGKKAALVAAIGVAAFMIFAYGLFGIFSLVAVIVNLILITGAMSMMGATLTLPGIAGLVLTVGMAVDANVLIFERIREEMRNGKQPISAIESGFSRAFGTIIDSNLTTLIAAIVMFGLGSGPVRGFAVTLSLGILATIFTAFTVTRLLISLWVASQKTRKIPAPL